MNKSSLHYVFRNFLYLLMFAAVPSVLLGIFRNANSPLTFFINFAKNLDGFQIDNFLSDVYGNFTFINFNRPILWLIACIVTFFGAIIIYTAVSRHMRMGIYTYNVFTLLNDGLKSSLLYYVFLLVAYEVCALVLSAIIMLLSLFLSGLALFIVSLILTIFGYFGYFCLFTATICTVPIINTEAYNFSFAMAYSINIVSNRFWNLFGKIIGLIAIGMAISSLSAFLLNGSQIVGSIIFIFMLLIFFPSIAMRNYILLTGSERRDIVKKVFKE